MATPFMSLMGTVVASLVSIYILKLKGENSPVPVFVFFGIVNLICMVLFALLPEKRKRIPRYVAMFTVGGILLVLAGILGKQNFQIEGFFFFALAGAFGGVMIHFFVGKIAGPLLHGRNWCGWGCWTVMILDLLPYKKGNGWVKGGSKFKYIYFVTALIGVFILMYGFNYKMSETGNSVHAIRAFYWFVIGNIFYYTAGIVLAVIMKDNRAFCKYVCPVSVFLKAGAVFTLLRIKGDASKCTNCGTCTNACLMSIDIPEYIREGKRVTCTECVMCMKCIAVCPEAALKASVGLDIVLKDKVKYN
ncbi:MAG: hypothetical protein A2015_08210 [Spirochaetes bacterium GWF1_31_7]|nr:MAG: hypothetical protein A2Y30_00905 [Spirochaetes bacterium GWE1_32_154]OHD49215.1 MAG: hypothetical protein A2Y29_08340 [Spirochaetes bacterium GWE2_31_10]OHD50437.1 MAG: hypothetical protein A2015_08210 [Spirochaetes bacterium GWF1_31_7]OHD77985.1 MAG: hypothetical protein A2355_18225 [Spirochaetes bacterium RIFOXYB1_FULL_32_8]